MAKWIVKTGKLVYPDAGARVGVPELITVEADTYDVERLESKKGVPVEMLHFYVGEDKVATFKTFEMVQKETAVKEAKKAAA